MIPSIVHWAAPHSFRVPSTSPSTEASSTSTNAVTTGTTTSRRSDVLSFSQAESLPTSDGYFQRTSLKVRANSQVKTTGDGDVLTTSKAKLRFSYDFEAADGTKIRVRAQANLNYAQLSGDDEQSQSMRLRVTAKVSILQENVASGLSPLMTHRKTPPAPSPRRSNCFKRSRKRLPRPSWAAIPSTATA